MDLVEALGKAREGMSVRSVFGEPIVNGDLLIIPVAKVIGGAGGGSGEDTSDASASGEGAGFGIRSAPVGLFMVKDGDITWHPSIDRTAVILGAELVAVVALLTFGSIVRSARRRPAGPA